MFRGKKISVVVPAHDECSRVGRVLATIPAFVDQVIVVDDASGDETAARAREAGDERVEVVRRRSNGGVGAAIVTGYIRALSAGADLVAVMAGDGQMDPDDLGRLLDPLVEGRAGYAKGNRLAHPDVLRAMPPVRLLGNGILTLLTRWATGLRISDSQCGYTAITREALSRITVGALYPRYGFPNDVLMKLAAAGVRVTDVTVRPIYHRGPGASGIVLRRFVPRVSWILLAGALRRMLSRGEWARPRIHGSARDLRPRALILTSSYPRRAGDHAGHFVAAIARRLALRHDVTVLAPWDGASPREESEGASLRVRRFRYAPLRSLHRVAYGAGIGPNLQNLAARAFLPAFALTFAIRGLVEARRADVVVSNWLLPGGAIGALCRAWPGRPHVAIEHGGGLWALRAAGRPGRRILAMILRRADRVICVSSALREELITEAAAAGLPMHARDVPVIPMGVDTRGLLASTRLRDVGVLFLGRLIPVKGVETLIDSLALLPGVTLDVAGEGPLERALRARAASLGSRVRFLGLVHGEAKRAALARSAVLAVPSVTLPGGRTEGLPVVVFEGMAAGCAVVASDVGGIGEVVRDGWNGFLVKPGDAQALADRIRWLLAQPVLRDSIGARAMESAAAYDADLLGDRIAEEIDRLAARRG